MKKKLLMMIFAGMLGFANAQSYSPVQRSDDAVAVVMNSAKDALILKSRDANLKIKSVTLYSILGTPVVNTAANSNYFEVSTDRLRPGKYLLRYILSDNSQKVSQIIIQ